jgi:multiple sugar transport system permease protein
MNPYLLYAIGTAATWLGWILLFRALYLGSRLIFKLEAGDPEGAKNALIKSGVIGGILLVASAALPFSDGRPVEAPIQVPLVWFLMPFPALGMFGSALFLALALHKALGALNDQMRNRALTAGFGWLLAGLGFYFWWQSLDRPIETFRGVLPMTYATAAGLMLLAVVAVVVMARTEHALRSRGVVKTGIIHLTLVAGCVVFGIPFFWLLMTSFKDQREILDVDSPWYPRTQEMVEFDDPERPLYETEHQGREVQATPVEGAEREGGIFLEIERPYNMRGLRFTAAEEELEKVPREVGVVEATYKDQQVTAFVVRELDDGGQFLEVMQPASLAGERFEAPREDINPVWNFGLRWENYGESLEYLPFETFYGLAYLKNTLIIVIMSVLGTVLSCSFVAYGFSRLRFPGKKGLFAVMISTMMLPPAVTMLPTFLIFRGIGWVDTLYPLWVPTFFGGAFNVFLLRQFFLTIPMELEDAAKIDGASYTRTYWQVMMPQIKPALAVISIWTFMGAWGNFMGPLIYVSTPEKMPIAYALQLFQTQRGGEYGMMMAFATMATIPVILLFFFTQRYFIEGVQLSGLGGK